MGNRSFTPDYNLPSRKVKGLIKLLGGLASSLFYTEEVVHEGAAMKRVTGTAFKIAAAGADEGASVIGLAMQVTFDESALTGQLAQLKHYHFSNDTAQRLDGQPIGLLMGMGHAILRGYQGAVTAGAQATVGASGVLATGGSSDSEVPVFYEEAGTGDYDAPENSDPVIVSFNFPVGA